MLLTNITILELVLEREQELVQEDLGLVTHFLLFAR